jgi:hypothetical protein
MTTSALARAEAAFQEQIHAQWRDWRAYLRAHLTLLDAELAPVSNAFEQAETQETRTAEAERVLATLAPAQRSLFDQVRDERRQQLLAIAEMPRLDRAETRHQLPVDVERQALVELLAEAEGTAEGDGRLADQGDVPLRIDGTLQWYRVSVSALLAAPGAAAYSVQPSTADDLRKRMVLAGMLGVGMVLFLALWFLWPRGRPATVNTALHPTGNDTPAEVWPVVAVHLGTNTTNGATLPVSPTTALEWPSVPANADQVFWNTSAIAPARLCVPARSLEGLSQIALIGKGEVPLRTYALSTTRDRADLVVEPCQQSATTAPRYGVLQATTPPVSLKLGEGVNLPNEERVTVKTIRVVGPGEDLALPAGAARIIVQVNGPALDWPAYVPTLLLETGERASSPEQVATTTGVELRYLVALPTGDLAVAWSFTPPGSLKPYRWRATLAPPPERLAVLRDALLVRDVAITAAPDGRTSLQFTLVNTSKYPLSLRSEDLTLTQGTSTLTLPDPAVLRQPLDPGVEQRIELPLNADTLSAPLVFTVGPYRFSIEF